MNLKEFENKKWASGERGLVFDQRAALQLIDKGPVLDLGCGKGILLEELKKKGIEGIGLDVSEEAVEQAKAKGLDVRQFDLSQTLPLEDSFFETVALVAVLEHLYLPQGLLKEAYRIAKSNVVVCVPNFNSLPARLQMLFGRIPENNRHSQGHLYWFSWEILKKILREAGFEIEKVKVNSFFSKVPVLKNLMQFLAQKIPSVFALVFVVKARKI